MTIDLSNWMRRVDGSKRLSELSIPGTHDSGSRNPQTTDADTRARLRTQSRTIAQQLDDGIRFLDIRIGYTNNDFSLYHENVSSGLTFQDVLDTCSTFLTAHSKETIIMSVKQETDAPTSGNDAIPPGRTTPLTFQGRFDKYVTDSPTGLFFQENKFPKLGTARGKIVLFRRFALDAGTSPDNHGINAFDRFPNDATGTIKGPPRLRIQDRFSQSGLKTRTRAEKWTAIEKLLKEAAGPGNADVLYVNFASAAGIVKTDFDNDYPNAVAEDINPDLETYFTAHTHGRFGIVVTDFETAARNALIVQTNFSSTTGT